MRPALVPLVAMALAGCAKAPDNTMQGYGEAQYVYVAAEDPGRISQLLVKEGDVVAGGAPLFRLDPGRQSIVAEGAQAAASAAAARTAQSGALVEAVRAAEANAALAGATYARSRALHDKGFVAQARLDIDAAALRVADAAVAEARANRDAAFRENGAPQADARLARRRVHDLDVTAPANGRVERVYHRAGEVVGAGAPVLALLPSGAMKVRFFAPERLLSSLRSGGRVAIHCDGCPPGLSGRITFIATEPQFTPPVIYSLDQREKLVFLVEAIPDDAAPIRPGLPVDITLAR